jgi:hypothetical protein
VCSVYAPLRYFYFSRGARDFKVRFSSIFTPARFERPCTFFRKEFALRILYRRNMFWVFCAQYGRECIPAAGIRAPGMSFNWREQDSKETDHGVELLYETCLPRWTKAGNGGQQDEIISFDFLRPLLRPLPVRRDWKIADTWCLGRL